MTTIDIPEAFSDLFDPSYRDYAYFGGRAGGKTHGVGAALVIQAAERSTRVVCAREIQRSIAYSSKLILE